MVLTMIPTLKTTGESGMFENKCLCALCGLPTSGKPEVGNPKYYHWECAFNACKQTRERTKAFVMALKLLQEKNVKRYTVRT